MILRDNFYFIQEFCLSPDLLCSNVHVNFMCICTFVCLCMHECVCVCSVTSSGHGFGSGQVGVTSAGPIFELMRFIKCLPSQSQDKSSKCSVTTHKLMQKSPRCETYLAAILENCNHTLNSQMSHDWGICVLTLSSTRGYTSCLQCCR